MQCQKTLYRSSGSGRAQQFWSQLLPLPLPHLLPPSSGHLLPWNASFMFPLIPPQPRKIVVQLIRGQLFTMGSYSKPLPVWQAHISKCWQAHGSSFADHGIDLNIWTDLPASKACREDDGIGLWRGVSGWKDNKSVSLWGGQKWQKTTIYYGW